MKNGWEVKTLNQISENLDRKRVPITKKNRSHGSIPYYGASGIVDYVEEHIFDEDLLLVSEDGANLLARTYPIALSISGKTWVNNHAHVLRFKDKISQRFVELYLNSIKLDDFVSGMAQPKLNQKMLNKIPIPFPPISKQKRIVAIFDEAFESIAKARESAEKNLKNANEIFDSYLNSITADKNSLGELVDIRTGKLDSNAAIKDGKYPFFTCSREIFAIDNFAFDCEAILLAGNNAVGDFNVKHYKGKFNAYQRTYVITVNQKNLLLYRYLYFHLLKSLKEFKQMSVGAGTKFLKLGMIKDLQISLPSITEQQRIVAKLDALSTETKKLEAIYTQKLADLEELKKSILQKAFDGELTEASA